MEAQGLGTQAQWFWQIQIVNQGSTVRHRSTVVSTNNWLVSSGNSRKRQSTAPQNRYTGFCQWGSWAGHTSTVVLKNENSGSLIRGTWPKIDIRDLINEAHGLGKWAQWFWQIHIWAPQCQAQDHKIDIPDLDKGAYGLGTGAQWFWQM